MRRDEARLSEARTAYLMGSHRTRRELEIDSEVIAWPSSWRQTGSTMTTYAAQVPALLLSFEHFLGGQARITSLLTPSLYRRAVVDKGPGTAEALYPIIPIKDHVRLTNFVGALMVLEGTLLALPRTRGSLGTLGLNTFLTAAGIYSQRRMGIPYWLPSVNMALGLLVWWIQHRWQL